MNINKHEISDDELDRLFRESAEKMEFDFVPDSWRKMSQKLDTAALASSSDQGTNPWPKRSLLLLIGLLSLVGTYYLFKPSLVQSTEKQVSPTNTSKNKKKTIDSIKYVATNKVSTDNLKSSEDVSKTIHTHNKPDISVKNAEPPTKNTGRFLEKKSIEKLAITTKSFEKTTVGSLTKTEINLSKTNKKNSFERKNTNSVNKSEDYISEKEVSRSSNQNISTQETNQLTDEQHLVLTKTSDFSSKETTYKYNKKYNKNKVFNNTDSNIGTDKNDFQTQNKTNQVNSTLNTPTEVEVTTQQNRLILQDLDLLSSKSTFIKSSIVLPIVAFENSQKQTPVIPKSKTQTYQSGLYFRFGVSPDMSLVTMNELTKSGNNLAFLLEYRFNKRLSIQTGVLRSMKYYDTYPESYEWPYNWPSPPKLIDISATCKMLDIPLNIRYDLSQKRFSRWFVSAGATSYNMLNEKYVYNYENPNDPIIKWKIWQGKTGPYYFGVLNFSAGYEYQLFRKLSIQAEPFFKMPITNVGFGKVSLSTLGVLISVKSPIFIHK